MISGLKLDTEILDGQAWKQIGAIGLDAPRLFSAFVRTLCWHCVTATDPQLFQSPFRAVIGLDAYQIEPLRKALVLPRVNLFIADDMGVVLAHRREERAEVALATGCCSAPASRPYRQSSMGSRPARMCSW